MRRIGVLAGLVSTTLVAGLVACSSKSPSSAPSQPAQPSGSIVVFAAASLKPVFTKIGQQFKADNPGNGVDFEFAGSSKIGSFADLAKPGINVVICQQPVPCGSATQRIENSTGVHLNAVSEELSVTDALNKVTTGQADAALVYVTDAKSAGDKVTTVNFPEAAGAVNVYPIGVLKKAPQSTMAQKFVALVTSDTGQSLLAQSGFAKP
jgi:molybdate transport system substrate-binding protein